ncbi:FAD-dependent oxidoreductase [Specibacter sp. RAF43]|uniref:FAD-dependent oxidoreductase n=1 Tax=Specibacter sp. RAF43 TaxID=3233057 RepID=UPI003F9EBA1D
MVEPAGGMVDVVIVGAGPVGLYLGALLLQHGVSVRVLEQRLERSTHSRAIGIHPPALAALAAVGVAPALLAEGVHIRRGEARSGGRVVSGLSFAEASSAGPVVLTLRQARTEAVLEARVRALDPAALVRGVHIAALHDAGSHLSLRASPGAGPNPCRGQSFRGRLVIGADGARSNIRRALGIPTRGRNYPDTYLMGDFPDDGADGAVAVLYLEPGGIVESFPLPDGLRRWVAHTDALRPEATAAYLAGLIQERTGATVDPAANSMLSAFAVRSRLAARMVRGRAALVGDAAHEISPIGGQGMNLGWLDAAALAPIIVAALGGEPTGARLARFERGRLRAARHASWQAGLNMALGRPLPASCLELRNAALAQAFRNPSLRHAVARRFTMQ